MPRAAKGSLTFEIFERWSLRTFSKNFYFRLKSANGEIMAPSQPYDTRQGAAKAVDTIKAKAANASIHDLTEQKDEE